MNDMTIFSEISVWIWKKRFENRPALGQTLFSIGRITFIQSTEYVQSPV